MNTAVNALSRGTHTVCSTRRTLYLYVHDIIIHTYIYVPNVGTCIPDTRRAVTTSHAELYVVRGDFLNSVLEPPSRVYIDF